MIWDIVYLVLVLLYPSEIKYILSIKIININLLSISETIFCCTYQYINNRKSNECLLEIQFFFILKVAIEELLHD